jgi:adenylylsulfate kinase
MPSAVSPSPIPPIPRGHVFWLFGLSGAGKSTLADRLCHELRSRGTSVLALDGDALRSGLCRGLGFSDEDRAENLRRAAESANLAVRSGLCVIASFITPRESHRQIVTAIIAPAELSLIYVSAPLEVCRARDVKGLYAGARTGAVPQMTGVSSAFEPPRQADLEVPTGAESVETSVARLVAFATARLADRR